MIYLLIMGWGLMIGSFLNVCIYRLPQHESIVAPPSHCTTCGTRLKPWDLIPVISYLLQRGKCRYCGERFSARYALVELLTGGLFVLCFIHYEFTVELMQAFVFVSFLIVITFIDLDHQLILDKVLLFFAPAGIILNLYMENLDAIDMLIGSLVGGGLLLLIAIVSRGGMGGGDIKFAAVLGLWLGYQLVLVGLFLSFLIGGVTSIVLLSLRIKKRKDMIPFGPFIAIGALLSLLYGPNIISWYLEKML